MRSKMTSLLFSRWTAVDHTKACNLVGLLPAGSRLILQSYSTWICLFPVLRPPPLANSHQLFAVRPSQPQHSLIFEFKGAVKLLRPLNFCSISSRIVILLRLYPYKAIAMESKEMLSQQPCRQDYCSSY